VKVSLISTVKNEQGFIEVFLDSVKAQTLQPDEVVIVDGGSTDQTVSLIEKHNEKNFYVKLIKGEKLNRPQGRNLAISMAKNEIIACSDVGCRLDERWLANITRPFQLNPDVDVVTGISIACPKTLFEHCNSYSIVTEKTSEDVTGWFRKIHRLIYKRRFSKEMPSSRSVAFKKSMWERVGGYPEDLDGGEDTYFNVRMKESGALFEIARDARVYWHPRSKLTSFVYQNFEYAREDGKGGLFVSKHLIRIISYLIGLILFVFGFYSFWFWVGLLFLAFVYLSIPIVEIFAKTNNPIVSFIVPFVFMVKDVSQMVGFASGFIIQVFKAKDVQVSRRSFSKRGR